MTTINQASLLKNSAPTLAQAEVAMQMIAQRANGSLNVTEDSNGSTVNIKNVTIFASSYKISRDTVTLSPSASAFISNQQVALSIIEDSHNKGKDGVTYKNLQKTSSLSTKQSAVQISVPEVSKTDTLSSALGNSLIGSEDPASVISDYTAESATERFYNSSQNPASIAKEFFASPEQQASYISAYNSGNLNIQSASSFESADFKSNTIFSSNGISSGGAGSGTMDLSSIKADNVMTFDDPIAGSIVISWNNNR